MPTPEQSDKDTVYAEKLSRVADFVFDERVAAVFPDMIARSVPGYQTMLSLLGVIAKQHLQPAGTVYDLGCSLGAAILSVQVEVADPTMRFIGIDNSAPMLAKCQRNLNGKIAPSRLTLVHSDISSAQIDHADMVMLNFTLQFIPPQERLALLTRIHAGLKPGGLLILSEKITFQDDDEQSLHQAMHQSFKIANHYSELEIAQKRVALEKVMCIDNLQTHRQRLRDAGFTGITQWFQAFNFCSLLAYK